MPCAPTKCRHMPSCDGKNEYRTSHPNGHHREGAMPCAPTKCRHMPSCDGGTEYEPPVSVVITERAQCLAPLQCAVTCSHVTADTNYEHPDPTDIRERAQCLAPLQCAVTCPHVTADMNTEHPIPADITERAQCLAPLRSAVTRPSRVSASYCLTPPTLPSIAGGNCHHHHCHVNIPFRRRPFYSPDRRSIFFATAAPPPSLEKSRPRRSVATKKTTPQRPAAIRE